MLNFSFSQVTTADKQSFEIELIVCIHLLILIFLQKNLVGKHQCVISSITVRLSSYILMSSPKEITFGSCHSAEQVSRNFKGNCFKCQTAHRHDISFSLAISNACDRILSSAIGCFLPKRALGVVVYVYLY